MSKIKLRFCAFLLLLFGAAHAYRYIREPDDSKYRFFTALADDEEYKGPVVCKGNKPLIIRNDAEYGSSPAAGKKQLHEQYWYQFDNHFAGCQIVVGNLIMPHQHGAPFENHLLNEAIKDIMIVTGYIYIYDVSLNLNFSSLRMVYGNEVFKLPEEWSKDVVGANDPLRTAEHAIFVEKFTGEKLHMPQLRYIKRGRFGFLDTPQACAFNPKEDRRSLDFSQFFDDPAIQKQPVNEVNSFTQCPASKISCNGGTKILRCDYCYDTSKDRCQPVTKGTFMACKESGGFYIGKPGENAEECCPDNSHGGCDYLPDNTTQPFHCKNGYFLVIASKDTYNIRKASMSRSCEKECHGLLINGTSICLKDAKVCPDYMFPFLGEYCSYECPPGFEVDPIGNYDLIADDQRRKYWSGKNVCKRCRVAFDTTLRDFSDDCGIQCVIPSNSLSFFTILNIYPSADQIADMDLTTFKEIFKGNKEHRIFGKKCRHIFGFLHIDQFSVGYPASGRRLIPEHLKPLTYATGLYGNIRIENTEGYWFAEPFRNLLVIQKPVRGRLPVDTQEFYGIVYFKTIWFNNGSIDYSEPYVDNSTCRAVTVRYNSDLRTVDLQRLQYVWGDILVQYNPLYIPPIPPKSGDSRVFKHIQETIDMKSDNKVVDEVVRKNGLDITRTGRKITYDSGCKGKNAISYYYKRCVTCASDEHRTFVDENHEYYARCQSESKCKIGDGSFTGIRDGEKVCLKCDGTCKRNCRDASAFECYTDGKLDCKGKKVDTINMKACVTMEEDRNHPDTCPGPFYGDENAKECKRCNSACKLCSGASDAYTWPGERDRNGCRTCGVVYSKYEKNSNKYTASCAGTGAEPRCAPGTDCHYFTTNPIRDAWLNTERATSDEFNEYGEQL